MIPTPTEPPAILRRPEKQPIINVIFKQPSDCSKTERSGRKLLAAIENRFRNLCPGGKRWKSRGDVLPEPREHWLALPVRTSALWEYARKSALLAALIWSTSSGLRGAEAGSGFFTYEKIHFTEDGSPTGTPLYPNFVWNSCWWALGNDDNGNIYTAISNEEGFPSGNVLVFKYDPNLNKMRFLNDLKSVSTAADNWLPTENQAKVHTRLLRGGDGRLYFATHDNSWGTLADHRGTHIYAIENDTITDLSKTATNYLNKAMETVQGNIGVHVENYGTIAMEMTRGTPRIIYGVTYGDGYFYRLNLETGEIRMIAQTGFGYSDGIIRSFALDNAGNAYVPMRGTIPGQIQIHKYDNTAGTWTDTGKAYGDGFLGANDSDKSGWRLHVYTKDGSRIYFITYDGSIFRFTFATEELEALGVLEADPDPRVSNLILSEDEQHLYALVYRYGGINQNKFVSFDIQTGQATTIDSNIATFGKRDLIFGGLAKDKLGHAYMVGWQFGNNAIDGIALFKIQVEPAVAPAPSLTIQYAEKQVSLDWNQGTLQTAEELAGPWSDLTGATHPLLLAPSSTQRYFRLKL